MKNIFHKFITKAKSACEASLLLFIFLPFPTEAYAGDLSVPAGGLGAFLWEGALDLSRMAVGVSILSLIVCALQYFLKEKEEGRKADVRKTGLIAFLALVFFSAMIILARSALVQG